MHAHTSTSRCFLPVLAVVLGLSCACSDSPPSGTDAADDSPTDEAADELVCPVGALLTLTASLPFASEVTGSRLSLASDGRELMLVGPSYDGLGIPSNGGMAGLRATATGAALYAGATLPWSGIPVRGDPYSGNYRLAGGDGYAVAWQSYIWNEIDLEPWEPHELIHVADPTRMCQYYLGVGWGDGAPCGAVVEAWNWDGVPRHVIDLARSGDDWTVLAADVAESCPPYSPTPGSALYCGCWDGYRTPPEPPFLTDLRLYTVVPPPQESARDAELVWSYHFGPALGSSVAVLHSENAGVRLAFAERAADVDPTAGWRIEARSFDWTASHEPTSLLAVPASELGVVGPLEVADFLVENDELVVAFYAGEPGHARTAHLALVPLDSVPGGPALRTASLGPCLRALRFARAPNSALLVGLCFEDAGDVYSPAHARIWHASTPAGLLEATAPFFRIEPTPPRTTVCQAIPAATAAGSYGLAVSECEGAGTRCNIELRLIGCP